MEELNCNGKTRIGLKEYEEWVNQNYDGDGLDNGPSPLEAFEWFSRNNASSEDYKNDPDFTEEELLKSEQTVLKIIAEIKAGDER